MSGAEFVGCVALALVAGLDLASVFQGLLARPLVIGTVTGWWLGDVEAGLRIGAVLELFALDVVPVGASRYPDFGAATVAAVVAGAGFPWPVSLGASVGLGVLLSTLAGLSLPLTRRFNARTVRALADRVAAGDAEAIRVAHLAGLGHDLVRSIVVGTAAVAVGVLARTFLPVSEPLARWSAMVVVGGGMWAAMHGAVSSARHGVRWRWLTAGLVVGLGLGMLH